MTDEVETPVTLLPDTTVENVEFTPAQQEKLDDILKKAMGRAGKEARAEAADLKAKLAAAELRLKAQAPDATRSDVLAAELEASKAEVASLKATSAESTKTAELQRLAMAENFIDVGLITTILAPRVQRQGNTYVVVNEDGTARQNAAGENQTLAEAVAQEAANRPYLVRGQVRSGGGGTSSSGTPPPTSRPLTFYFGPGSNSAATNALSIQRPDEYRRLRQEAVKIGLVAGSN
jgi:hypothetical protein